MPSTQQRPGVSQNTGVKVLSERWFLLWWTSPWVTSMLPREKGRAVKQKHPSVLERQNLACALPGSQGEGLRVLSLTSLGNDFLVIGYFTYSTNRDEVLPEDCSWGLPQALNLLYSFHPTKPKPHGTRSLTPTVTERPPCTRFWPLHATQAPSCLCVDMQLLHLGAALHSIFWHFQFYIRENTSTIKLLHNILSRIVLCFSLSGHFVAQFGNVCFLRITRLLYSC